MNKIVELLHGTLILFLQMAPWLLLGFFVAGFLHLLLPKRTIFKHLSGNGVKTVIKASLLGVPLPLCSCGVIPVAAHLRKQGAGKGATVSFLASTPGTGVDSIMATYALMGPIFAIFRPIYAFASGILAGVGVLATTPVETVFPLSMETPDGNSTKKQTVGAHILSALHYGFIELVDDVQKWLLIGIAAGGIISFALPSSIFTQTLSNPVWSYAAMLLIGIPMYVCATGSIPIAASLLMKGMSPGAGLVFLAVGPATNAATLSFIVGAMGKRSAAIYLGAIAVSAISAGLIMDLFFISHVSTFFNQHIMGDHLSWVEYTSGALLGGLLLWNIVPKPKRKFAGANQITLHIPAMTCQGCAQKVRTILKNTDGITDYQVDLATKTATVCGTVQEKNLLTKLKKDNYPATIAPPASD